MHSSQAKALVKGCYRIGTNTIEKVYEDIESVDKLNPKHQYRAITNMQVNALKEFSIYTRTRFDRNRKYRFLNIFSLCLGR